ncbi:hypothetical protein [Streptomyces lavendulae]|uniref:hypothetical protein n=1 Tax=Streptomyces lavendulae TaxID=1914 RepID=UPI0036E1040B
MKKSTLIYIPCRITILGQPGEVVLSEGEDVLPYQIPSDELAAAKVQAASQRVSLDELVFAHFGKWWTGLPVTKDLLAKIAAQEPSYQKVDCRISQSGNIIWAHVN